MSRLHIVLGLLAAVAAAVLFATYGTAPLSAPFASIQLNGPTAVDSDGEFTVVADTESRRALIMDADGDLAGVINCTTVESPIEAITDVCVSNGYIYLAGVRYKLDSGVIDEERVAVYDEGGKLLAVVFSIAGDGSEIHRIKALNDAPDGVAVAHIQQASSEGADNSEEGTGEGLGLSNQRIAFDLVSLDGSSEIGSVESGGMIVHDAAVSIGGEIRYAVLDVLGVLGDDKIDYSPYAYAGHVFTSVDIDGAGLLYACDDETGALCVITQGAEDVRTLVEAKGFHSVHVNNDVISLCNIDDDRVMICDTSGDIKSVFGEVEPSIGFAARMLVVWASGLYLVALVVVLAVRKVWRLVKEGRTESIRPVLLAVAVVSAIAVVIVGFSYSSYQKQLELRAKEINMCADYLSTHASGLCDAIEKVDDRDALFGSAGDDEAANAAVHLLEEAESALSLVGSANQNGIGMYCTFYAKDEKGIYYLYGSSHEYVLGTSARGGEANGLAKAFEVDCASNGKLLTGRTLRDAAQYRLVQVPSSDGKSVVGVIEIGSKMRSFESSIATGLTQRVLGLLVLMLVVYLVYSELRACGLCLIRYRQRQEKDAVGAIASLTRPFMLAVTILISIDSVMTVLIARNLLERSGIGDAGPLLAVPAVMLGIGLIVGQGLYGILGSRVGLRRLMAGGASVLLFCALFAAVSVESGVFWMYCVAKFAMAVPLGMLHTMGFSLPRLARNSQERAEAVGGRRRITTSAPALGTVLGGYAAQSLGDVWVYVVVALACLPVLAMALNLLSRGMRPFEELVQSDHTDESVFGFMKSSRALAIALFVVLPVAVAAGYASFLFPLFSSDLGLSKSDVNNIVVLGQLVVFVCIGFIERVEGRYGAQRIVTGAVALLGVVFLLFAINMTLAWSVAVIAIVGLLCKSTDGWRELWQEAAGRAGVPAGRAMSAMLAAERFALVVQSPILAALLGVTDSLAVIAIGLICVVCAGLFFTITRRTSVEK